MVCIALPSTAIDVSCYSSVQDRNAACLQIQRDISALTQKILELKTRHNSLNITARLPDELLARIFTWNLSMQRPDINYGWLKVAAVCASWRRIALACPHLWGFIRHEGTIEWLTEVILPRSGAIPLQIWIDLGQDLARRRSQRTSEQIETRTMCCRALEEIHRARELLLMYHHYYSQKQTFRDLLSSLTKPAPILEYLKVKSSSDELYRLPDNLFAHAAPKLRKLEVTNCTIPTGSSVISGLTILKLEYSSTLARSDVSLSQLMTLLGSATNLETLKLVDSYHIAADERMPSEPYIVLPHLTHLAIEDYTHNCCILLSCIAHPTTTHRDILLYDLHEVDNARAIGNKLGLLVSSVDHLTIKFRSKECIVEVRGRSTDEFSSNTAGFHTRFQKSWQWLVGLQAFLEILPMSDVEFLCIQGQLPASFLLDVFGDKASLHTINIQKYTRTWFQVLLNGVSQQELMATVTTGEDKWVDASKCTNGNGGLESESGFNSDSESEGSSDVIPLWFQNDSSVDSVDAVNYEQLIRMSELSDEAKLAELKLHRTSGPLHFTSLRYLKIDLCQENDDEETFFVDTTVLAAVLHLRKARGLPVHQLSVESSRSLSPNADRDLAVICKSVGSLNWDVQDGLVRCREGVARQRGQDTS